MERIALVSDIHGNIAALETVAADIKHRNVDSIINLGDNISGPLWPKETIKYLAKQNWIHIRGNHDSNLIKQNPAEHGLSDRYAFQFLDDADKKWLAGLPSILEMRNGLLLFHGTPTNDKVYLLETVEQGRARLASYNEIIPRLGDLKQHIILCGHTHIPRVVQLPGEIMIINPGSVGLQAYDDVLPEPHVMETGSPHTRYSIIENRDGIWSVEMIVLEYDYRSAAERAKMNNRPDWVIALETGYMSH